MSSDPRLTGDVVATANWILDPDGDPDPPFGRPNELWSTVRELTNDGGSWLGEGASFSSADLDVGIETITFVGEGGYEGLTAYVVRNDGGETFSGVIVPTAMPEMPEPYVADQPYRAASAACGAEEGGGRSR